MADSHILEQLTPDFGYYYRVGEVVHEERTDYQHLRIVDTPAIGRVMLLDGVTQVATENEFLYHEPMVHPALIAHPDPKRVCVVGAGDGGIVREVVKHRPEEVHQFELDRRVNEVCREYMPQVSDGVYDDPRVNLVFGDGRALIAEHPGRFDVVIMDMTDPFGPSTMLYTEEYYREVKRSLRDHRGSFVMHCESPISRPRAYQQILRTLGRVWSHQEVFYVYIQMYAVLWSIVVSADHGEVGTIAGEEIARRLADRDVGPLQVYTPRSHHAMRTAYPFIERIREDAADVPAITDEHYEFIDEIDLGFPDLEMGEGRGKVEG